MARPHLSPKQVDERRAEILDAAQDLFKDQGLKAVSLRRIAARAGCSPATPYRYFPSKAHVLLGLRIRAYEAIRLALEAAATTIPDPLDRLRAIAAAYIRFAIEDPATYDLLFHVGFGPEEDPDLSEAKAQALDVCRRALSDAVANDKLQLDTDVLTAAHLFWAAAHGIVSLHLGGQLVMGRSLDHLAPALIATLTAGLSPGRAKRARPEKERQSL